MGRPNKGLSVFGEPCYPTFDPRGRLSVFRDDRGRVPQLKAGKNKGIHSRTRWSTIGRIKKEGRVGTTNIRKERR